MISPRGDPTDETAGLAIRRTPESGVSVLGVTGRANVAVENCDVVGGEIRDGAGGIVPVTDAPGCNVADGETTAPDATSANASELGVKPLRFGGDGSLASSAGFVSGMVTVDDTWNGLYSGLGRGSCSNVGLTGISA